MQHLLLNPCFGFAIFFVHSFLFPSLFDRSSTHASMIQCCTRRTMMMRNLFVSIDQPHRMSHCLSLVLRTTAMKSSNGRMQVTAITTTTTALLKQQWTHQMTLLQRNYTSIVRSDPMLCTSGSCRSMISSCNKSNSSNNKNNNNNNTNRIKPKAVFLNATRLNYDNQLDFSEWYELVNLDLNNTDRVDDIETVLRLVQDAEIVITKEMTIPASTLQHFPNTVRLFCEAGTGYNNLPVKEARARNISVCNTPTYSTEAVAHTAITYLLNFSASMFQQQHMLHCQKDRSNFTGPVALPLHEVNDKVLGLVGGSGRIGTMVAQIGLALGMRIVISSRRGTLPEHHILYHHPNVSCTSNLKELLQQSDYVSLHTPLNEETRGSFGRDQITQMKASAFLINTSRGAVCNESELIECLREKIIAGAGLDVTTTEPPAFDSPLWELDNVYLSPHTGWRRLETRQRLVQMTADNLRAYCNATNETEYINVVN